MPKLTEATPKYCYHRGSKQAVVYIGGKTHYLGPYGTKASRREYDRLIQAWLDNGRRLPDEGAPTVVNVLAAFRRHAEKRNSRDELTNLDQAMRPVRLLFGDVAHLARDFGPKKLKAVRELMIAGYTDEDGEVAGLSRGVVNNRIGRVRRIFRWAESEELVPAGLTHSLKTVDGLKRGERRDCLETDPVRPAPEKDVDAALPRLPEVIADMVRVQRLTGCRPGEVCAMRPVGIDRNGDPWVYRPSSHKTAHRGHERVIFIGPRAQQILQRYLFGDPYCFSPTNGRSDRYTTASYRRAVTRACNSAGVPRWTPHRLRHSAATEIRARYGLEASQVVLGHRQAAVTQIYAERNEALASKIMKEIG